MGEYKLAAVVVLFVFVLIVGPWIDSKEQKKMTKNFIEIYEGEPLQISDREVNSTLKKLVVKWNNTKHMEDRSRLNTAYRVARYFGFNDLQTPDEYYRSGLKSST
jgi:hypothetical protein